jgi:hypothetical protein
MFSREEVNIEGKLSVHCTWKVASNAAFHIWCRPLSLCERETCKTFIYDDDPRLITDANEDTLALGQRVVRRLRCTIKSPHEIFRDPESGAIIDQHEGDVVWLMDYVYWRGAKECIRFGYRATTETAPPVLASLRQLLRSLRFE